MYTNRAWRIDLINLISLNDDLPWPLVYWHCILSFFDSLNRDTRPVSHIMMRATMQTVNIVQDIKTNPVGARRDTALVPSLWGPMMMYLTENSLSFVCTGGIGNHRSAGTFSNALATICLIVKQLKWSFPVSVASSLSISIATKWEVELHGAFNEYSSKTVGR